MERDKALGILKALADGVDPATGEQFPPGSSYQYPDTVRALYHAVQALEGPAQPASVPSRERNRSAPENAGRPWSDEEDERLAQAFDSGKTVLQLADEHKRSRIAIEARLVKLEKISAPQNGTMRYPVKGRGAASGASERVRMYTM